MTRIGVTGSTGHIGGLVAKALVAAPTPDQTLRLIVRDPLRVPALRLPGLGADAADPAVGAATTGPIAQS